MGKVAWRRNFITNHRFFARLPLEMQVTAETSNKDKELKAIERTLRRLNSAREHKHFDQLSDFHRQLLTDGCLIPLTHDISVEIHGELDRIKQRIEFDPKRVRPKLKKREAKSRARLAALSGTKRSKATRSQIRTRQNAVKDEQGQWDPKSFRSKPNKDKNEGNTKG